MRWAWRLLAYAALAMGLLGIVVPGLPTGPFVLLAAYAAARGSAALHRRLLSDPRFGPMIVGWQRHGQVPRRGKWLALAAMALSAALLALAGPGGWRTWLPIAAMAVVAGWLWRRPEPPR